MIEVLTILISVMGTIFGLIGFFASREHLRNREESQELRSAMNQLSESCHNCAIRLERVVTHEQCRLRRQECRSHRSNN